MDIKGRDVQVRDEGGRSELYIDGVHIPSDYSEPSKTYHAHHHIPNWAFDSLEEVAVALIDNHVKLALDHQHDHHDPQHHHDHHAHAGAPGRAVERDATTATTRLRRNQLKLSDAERARYVAAVKQMTMSAAVP